MSAQPFPIEQLPDGPLPGCLIVRLEQPGSVVVVLDEPLLRRLEATLKSLPARAPGLILASASERVFIAGADLKSIRDLDDDALDRYLAYGQRVFSMLLELRYPTAAAINGAALGGGLELAMHCDLLVACPSPTGRPYPIGLPEASLGICPGWGGTTLLPGRIDPITALRHTAAGRPFLYDEACAEHLFDRHTPEPANLITEAQSALAGASPAPKRDGAPSRWAGHNDRLTSTAAAIVTVAHELAQTDPGAAVRRCVEAGLEAGWRASLDAERRELLRLRRTPAATGAIEAFFAKSGGTKK